jgi:hypothetical protein
MNYMFYEYIGSFIYNRCAILFCGVRSPSLIPQVGRLGVCPVYDGGGRENTGQICKCLHFLL